MNFVKNILCILLATAFFNVVVAKSVHEFFEHGYAHEHAHEHQSKKCSSKDLNHFHQHEFTHFDFICAFNFSSSFFNDILNEYTGVIRYQEDKFRIQFLWLAKNLCSRSISLRGPPAIS